MSTPDEKSPMHAGGEQIDAAELREAEQYHSKENFLKLHRPQFQGMGLPPRLGGQVYDKLLNEQFDALEYFDVEYVEDEGFRVVVKKEEGIKKEENVFVLDHLWTTSMAQGVKQLHEIDGLVDRLWTLADMDRRIEEERAAARAEAEAQAASAAPAAAAAPAPPLELDEGVLATIMSEGHVSRERAEEAFRANRGDLIASIVWLQGESEQEKEAREQMESMLEAQAQMQLSAKSDENPLLSLPEDLSTLTQEQKIPLLWEALFKQRLLGSYFTTAKADVSASSLTQEDVQATLFVEDEFGSAVGQANDAANANAVMQPLVCVTLGGVGFSLLWITQDLKQGDEVLIAGRPPIRLPGAPWPKPQQQKKQ